MEKEKIAQQDDAILQSLKESLLKEVKELEGSDYPGVKGYLQEVSLSIGGVMSKILDSMSVNEDENNCLMSGTLLTLTNFKLKIDRAVRVAEPNTKAKLN